MLVCLPADNSKQSMVRSFHYWKQRNILLLLSYHDRIFHDNVQYVRWGRVLPQHFCLPPQPLSKDKSMKRIPVWVLASNSKQPSGLWFTTCTLHGTHFAPRRFWSNAQSQQLSQCVLARCKQSLPPPNPVLSLGTTSHAGTRALTWSFLK